MADRNARSTPLRSDGAERKFRHLYHTAEAVVARSVEMQIAESGGCGHHYKLSADGKSCHAAAVGKQGALNGGKRSVLPVA